MKWASYYRALASCFCFIILNITISFLSLLSFDLHLACRWFCEGKELHNTPDIQIRSEGGDLHTLIIAEAFEDDTGRYTCLATNPSGSDTTSAEVFIEGKGGAWFKGVDGDWELESGFTGNVLFQHKQHNGVVTPTSFLLKMLYESNSSDTRAYINYV